MLTCSPGNKQSSIINYNEFAYIQTLSTVNNEIKKC